MIDYERDPSRFCYCDECRGDGRREPSEIHDPYKPPDSSKAACDARDVGLMTYLEDVVRPYMASVARAKAWGVDPESEPVAV